MANHTLSTGGARDGYRPLSGPAPSAARAGEEAVDARRMARPHGTRTVKDMDTLELELASLLRNVPCSDRQARALAIRFGYCGGIRLVRLDADRDVVSAGERLDPTLALSPLERELLAVFRAHGRILRLTEARRLAELAGLNSTSATLSFLHSPVFQSVARGRYAVRGAWHAAGQTEAVAA